MIKHMLSSALLAGFAVGLLVALLQYGFIEKEILLAEDYESGAKVHFQGVKPPETVAPAGHGMAAMAEREVSGLVRQGLTVLFAFMTYAGYALLMVAAFAVAGQQGYAVPVQTGPLWGLAGFVVFQMAPAMGLQPDLPGTPGADLAARQWWWLGTAVMTAGGLVLLAYGHGLVARLAGVGLMAVPHVVGAPELGSFAGVVPPELAGAFATRTLGIGLVAWVTTGGLLAWLWAKDAG